MADVLDMITIPGMRERGGLGGLFSEGFNAVKGHVREQYDRGESELPKQPGGRRPTSKLDQIVGDALGGSKEGADKLRTEKTNFENEKKYKPMLQSVNVDFVPGLDPGTYERLYVQGQKAINRKDIKDIENDAYNSLQQVRDRQRQDDATAHSQSLLQQQITNQNAQFDKTQAYNTKRDAQSQMHNLQFLKLQQEADANRYQQEREWYEDDKRSDSIAALVASLASLGGAFAL